MVAASQAKRYHDKWACPSIEIVEIQIRLSTIALALYRSPYLNYIGYSGLAYIYIYTRISSHKTLSACLGGFIVYLTPSRLYQLLL